MHGNKFTGDIEWVECDKYGNDIDHDLEEKKNSSQLTLDLDKLMNDPVQASRKNNKNRSRAKLSQKSSSKASKKHLNMSISGEK